MKKRKNKRFSSCFSISRRKKSHMAIWHGIKRRTISTKRRALFRFFLALCHVYLRKISFSGIAEDPHQKHFLVDIFTILFPMSKVVRREMNFFCVYFCFWDTIRQSDNSASQEDSLNKFNFGNDHGDSLKNWEQN